MRTRGAGVPLERRAEQERWLRMLGMVVCVALFAVGMWSVPLAILGPGQTLIPGDLGDARFNNYILEHFHCYITGRTPSYWDAPFNYPYRNVIALSDNLLGTAPIYSALRFLGYDRENAFQLWLLVLFALNYWCCFHAVTKWSGNRVMGACAAYVFAFGIYTINNINNVQMLPKFMAPLAFLFLWRHLGTGSRKYLYLAMAATVYQFYCGIYLGFILLYVLFFLFIGHVIAYRTPSYFRRFASIRFAAGWLWVIIVGALLLAPLMWPYLKASEDVGMRDFKNVVDTVPRPSSFFFTHPAALSWRSLSEVCAYKFPQWWCHFLFIGALPWLAVVGAPVLFFLRRRGSADRAELIALMAALSLSILFCVNMNGFTLYAWVFELPGFSALRAVHRYINVQVLYFLFLLAVVARPLFSTPRMALIFSILLPVLVVQDDRWDVHFLKRFDKYEARALTHDVERRITREYKGPAMYDAIAYEPPRSMAKGALSDADLINIHLTAMIAGQDLGIPVVNAYTGSMPGNYSAFYNSPSEHSLKDWCTFNGITADRIQWIMGLGVSVSSVDTVHVRSANGHYVRANLAYWNLAMADQDDAWGWETFVRLRTDDGHVAFLCANSEYLCAELEQKAELSATAEELGDYGLFQEVALDSGAVAFKAFNGRYVTVDSVSSELRATAAEAGVAERFRVIPVH